MYDSFVQDKSTNMRKVEQNFLDPIKLRKKFDNQVDENSELVFKINF